MHPPGGFLGVLPPRPARCSSQRSGGFPRPLHTPGLPQSTQTYGLGKIKSPQKLITRRESAAVYRASLRPAQARERPLRRLRWLLLISG